MGKNVIGCVGQSMPSYNAMTGDYSIVGNELDLSHRSSLCDAGAEAIADLLYNSSTLKTLKLDDCSIGDAGARHIAYALRRNTTLEVLELSMNGIGLIGVRNLAGALIANNTLKKLNLSDNRLSLAGVGVLAYALRRNTTLEVLELGEQCRGYDDSEPTTWHGRDEYIRMARKRVDGVVLVTEILEGDYIQPINYLKI